MSEANDSWNPNKDMFYSEICSKIRATDDISFKLLGFVPLLSGSAIFLLLFKGSELKHASIVLLCIAGAVVTIGLFLWERRNIKTCKMFREAAAELEAICSQDWIKPYSVLEMKNPPRKYSSIMGKTEAEIIIYMASILVWVIPIINFWL